jgi:hypothetical protein
MFSESMGNLELEGQNPSPSGRLGGAYFYDQNSKPKQSVPHRRD